MKALSLTLTIFLMLTSAHLQGQDITGNWSGTLSVQGTQLRVVFHVNKTNNQYEATFDSPDQNMTGAKVTTITVAYPNIKFEMSGIAAVYEGTMSGKGITGKWVQSGTALYLVLVKNEEAPDKDKKRIK
jgi:hypothetical protein